MSRVRTAIVTDSTAAPVPGAVQVVELDVVVDDRAQSETGVDLDDLLAQMRAGAVVRTSRPSPDGFARAYRAAAAAGASAVVSVHLAAALSGTVDAARLAARTAPIRVEVVDSGTVAAVLSAAVEAATLLSAAGADAGRVARAADRVLAGSRTWFSPATSSHLRAGGRGPDESDGRLLTARPLLVVEGGRLVPLERARTTARVMVRLCDLAAAWVGSANAVGSAVTAVVVQHAGALDGAQALARRLREQWPVAGSPPVSIRTVSPVVAAHVGPGALGVAVVVSATD